MVNKKEQKKLIKLAVNGKDGLIEILSQKFNPAYVKKHLNVKNVDKHVAYFIFAQGDNYLEMVGYSCPKVKEDDMIFPFNPYTGRMITQGLVGLSVRTVTVPAFECKYCGYVEKEKVLSEKDKAAIRKKYGIDDY